LETINLLYLFNRFLVEDKNIVQFDCDEEIDFSKQCIITAFSPIEDFNKLLENGFNSVIGIAIFSFSYSYLYILYLLSDSKKL